MSSHSNREQQNVDRESNDFLAEGAHSEVGPLKELWLFMMDNKKWWLIPIILAILIVAGLATLSSGGGGVFIYSLW